MKQVWLADDGTVCETEEEARKRDRALTQSDEIREFVKTLNASVRRQTEYAKAISAWVSR